MAVYGNVTNRDLTGWGPKLMGGLVALIVCGLVGGLFSLFGFGFGIMDLVLCAVGLLIFMGLTAYDTQMLKYYYSYFGGDAAMLHKSSITRCRLNLYLDFIQHLPVYPAYGWAAEARIKNPKIISKTA